MNQNAKFGLRVLRTNGKMHIDYGSLISLGDSDYNGGYYQGNYLRPVICMDYTTTLTQNSDGNYILD